MTHPSHEPPAQGPFTITYEHIPYVRGEHERPTWQRLCTVKHDEPSAVAFWQDCHMYANMRPVDIVPEPRWNRYTYDGHTPLTR